jgi:hypothetical protein
MRYLVFLFITSLPALADGAIQWDHWSPLTVGETITDIGGGNYKYEYSFVNTDISPIIAFAVYLTFEAQQTTIFSTHPDWNRVLCFAPMNVVAPTLDARNLDPAIIGLVYIDNGRQYVTHTEWPYETAIKPGEYASGFSFIASVYDSSPKYYCYELFPYPTGLGGKVAAVGLTVPEPASLLLLGLGGLALLRKPKDKRYEPRYRPPANHDYSLPILKLTP